MLLIAQHILDLNPTDKASSVLVDEVDEAAKCLEKSDEQELIQQNHSIKEVRQGLIHFKEQSHSLRKQVRARATSDAHTKKRARSVHRTLLDFSDVSTQSSAKHGCQRVAICGGTTHWELGVHVCHLWVLVPGA